MPRIDIETLVSLTRAAYEAEDEWRQNSEDGLGFLRHMAHADDVVLYATGPSLMLHGVLMPARKATRELLAEAQRGNGPILPDTWRIEQVYGGGAGHRMHLKAPLAHTAFAGGEKLVFRRDFHGMGRQLAALELSQKFVHSLEVHYVEEQRAYCRLDEHGDLEEVIRVFRCGDDPWTRIEAVTIRRAELDRYMALSGSVLLLRFDFTRHPDENFIGFHSQKVYERQCDDAVYHGGVTAQASYCNGVFRIAPQVTRRQLIQAWKRREAPKRQRYASFIAQNLRDGKVVEVSCSPCATANYFQKSDKPIELSPAFFRPDVLSKYKLDPDKYELRDRDITCRGTWTLRGTDVNESGQVHAYLCDLRKLPYTEQIYWRSFNEPPQGGISTRAIRTDFLGQWDITSDPLRQLRETVAHLDASRVQWWKARGVDLPFKVQYVRTQSSKEWSQEILALDQFLIEGFVETPLREWAAALHRPTKDFRSVRLVQEILTGLGLSEEQARATTAPLAKLKELRNFVAGHATGEKRDIAIREARSVPGGLPAHFHQLLERCGHAMSVIAKLLQSASAR